MPGKKQTARRRKVAEGAVRGKPAVAIAAETGVSRATVHRDLAALETKQVIAELTAKYHAEMEKLFEKTVATIGEAFGARKTALSKNSFDVLRDERGKEILDKDGEKIYVERVIDMGPDYYARLAAAKCAVGLMVAGKPIPKAPEPSSEEKPVTLEQMQSLLQSHAQTHPISKP